MKRITLLLGCFILIKLTTHAQETIPLYKGRVPNNKSIPDKEFWNQDHTAAFQVSHPTLSIYLPIREDANGTAVVVCPGGGYHALMMEKEGFSIAKRLNKMGIAAFVLKYRLPDDRTMINKTIGPLQDAQQAVKIVRDQAQKWHIQPDKVGIMGFSAGGHVASTAGTHFDSSYIQNKLKTNLRPDFMMLVYPVVSMADSLAHKGSRTNLLGKNPSKGLVHQFSNELQVSAATPPAFIVQAEDDSAVIVANSFQLYLALHKHKIPVALHIYQKGGHGFGKYPPRDIWMKELKYWMKANGWLE